MTRELTSSHLRCSRPHVPSPRRSDPQTVDQLLTAATPLLADPPQSETGITVSGGSGSSAAVTAAMAVAVVADQQLAAQLVHLVPRDDTDAAYEVTVAYNNTYFEGVPNDDRVTV